MSDFKYSAYIENTPEIRAWLDKIGYIPEDDYRADEDYLYCYTNMSGESKYSSCMSSEIAFIADSEEIDCTGSPDLFRAVTAVRSGSDMYQWFYNYDNKEFRLCLLDDVYDCFPLSWMMHAVKAPAERLIEKFKINNKK